MYAKKEVAVQISIWRCTLGSYEKHGCQRQFLILMSRFSKIFSSETTSKFEISNIIYP
jgi:hypothetical protein